VWLQLQTTRDTDGLQFLPMETIDGGEGGSYRVPDAEGRMKLYGWISALHGVADDQIETVCQLARRIQAEREERYFRPGLLLLAVTRLEQHNSNQSNTTAQRDAEIAAHQARYETCRNIAADELRRLQTQDVATYNCLYEEAETALRARVSPEKRRLYWAEDVWRTTVESMLLTRLTEQKFATLQNQSTATVAQIHNEEGL
jgi:hypothetical protein